jgi:hypothetical protein
VIGAAHDSVLAKLRGEGKVEAKDPANAGLARQVEPYGALRGINVGAVNDYAAASSERLLGGRLAGLPVAQSVLIHSRNLAGAQ